MSYCHKLPRSCSTVNLTGQQTCQLWEALQGLYSNEAGPGFILLTHLPPHTHSFTWCQGELHVEERELYTCRGIIYIHLLGIKTEYTVVLNMNQECLA